MVVMAGLFLLLVGSLVLNIALAAASFVCPPLWFGWALQTYFTYQVWRTVFSGAKTGWW